MAKSLSSTDSVDDSSDSNIVIISHSQRPPQFEYLLFKDLIFKTVKHWWCWLAQTPLMCHLKWSDHHTDRHSSSDSPQWKCLKVLTSSLLSQLPPSSSPPQTPMEGNSPGYDVFGKTQVAATDSDQSGSHKGTLFQYWAQELTEKWVERVQQEFEELKGMCKRSKLADKCWEVEHKSQEQAQIWEHQQKHREKLCNIKIASGWTPRQKWMSCTSLQLWLQLWLLIQSPQLEISWWTWNCVVQYNSRYPQAVMPTLTILRRPEGKQEISGLKVKNVPMAIAPDQLAVSFFMVTDWDCSSQSQETLVSMWNIGGGLQNWLCCICKSYWASNWSMDWSQG